MFADLDFDVDTIDEFPAYCAPITSQEGTIIVNTEMMEENNLPHGRIAQRFGRSGL